MPAYGHRMTYEDRWHVVNYVRRLQDEGSGGAVPADTVPDTTADTAAADTAGEG